jgi:hypothetical protein
VPWWLLTHYPEASDLFTWLDGALILGYLLGGGFLLGSLLLIGPALAARLLETEHLTWQRFTLALTPLAAASVILGLSMLTVTHLKAEHLWLGWLPWFRIISPARSRTNRKGQRTRTGQFQDYRPPAQSRSAIAAITKKGTLFFRLTSLKL